MTAGNCLLLDKLKYLGEWDGHEECIQDGELMGSHVLMCRKCLPHFTEGLEPGYILAVENNLNTSSEY